jgi:hypothetical protein
MKKTNQLSWRRDQEDNEFRGADIICLKNE